MDFPYAKKVTYVDRSPSGQDLDGNDAWTETQTTTAAVFAPGGSAEITTGGDMVNTQPTLYGVDQALPVKSTDRFIVDGISFEVDGDPQAYLNPFTGWAPGLVVPLRRVTG